MFFYVGIHDGVPKDSGKEETSEGIDQTAEKLNDSWILNLFGGKDKKKEEEEPENQE